MKLATKHVAILAAGVLAASGTWLFYQAGRSQAYVEGFKPYATESGARGFHVVYGRKPFQGRRANILLGSACFVMVGLIGSVKDGDRPLINPETLSQDIPDAIAFLAEDFNELFAGAVGAIASGASSKGKQVARAIVHLAPPLEQLVSQAERVAGDRAWMEQFMEAPHHWVVGRTRSGKTFLQLMLLKFAIERNSNLDVRIWDIHYGKPDKTGWRNFWMQIDRSRIQNDPAQIAIALDEEYRDMIALGQEQADPNKPVRRIERLIVISELNGLVARMGTKRAEDFIEKLGCMLAEASGYGWVFNIDSQFVAVKETGISQAKRAQTAVCISGSDAQNPQFVSAIAQNSDILCAEVQKLQAKGKRAVVVQLPGDGACVRVVPEMPDAKEWRVVTAPIGDPDTEWWVSQWTETKQRWLQELADDFVARDCKQSPLKKFVLPGFGITNMSRDERYKKFVKPAWEQAIAIAKGENSEP